MCAHHLSTATDETFDVQTTADPTSTTSVDHVGLSVRDLEAAVTFYTAAFDLREEFRFEVAEHGMSAIMLRSTEGWAIELMHRADSVAPTRHLDPDREVLNQGYGHFCLRVQGSLEQVYDRFIAAGGSAIKPPQPGMHPQVRFSYAADPEGNLVELISFLPGFGA